MGLFNRSTPERQEYRAAREALDANCAAERKAGITEQTEENAELNRRVRAAEGRLRRR